MFADTAAVQMLGHGNDSLADDIADVAAALASLPVAQAADSLGPVGARFLDTLAGAVAHQSAEVTALGRRVRVGGAVAHASAEAYEVIDVRAGSLLATTGWAQ